MSDVMTAPRRATSAFPLQHQGSHFTSPVLDRMRQRLKPMSADGGKHGGDGNGPGNTVSEDELPERKTGTGR